VVVVVAAEEEVVDIIITIVIVITPTVVMITVAAADDMEGEGDAMMGAEVAEVVAAAAVDVLMLIVDHASLPIVSVPKRRV
jgi:hypothetical protein